MKNIGGTSEYIAFFDESGDHSLSVIDKDFPLFLLALIIVKRTDYINDIIPAINKVKLKYWNHEGINLHSRDIRKSIGPFTFMTNEQVRTEFLKDISDTLNSINFHLFISAIHKQKHKSKYGDNANHPYELSITFTMERILHFLKNNNQKELPIIAESRGKNEDDELEIAFLRIINNGTCYHSSEEFKQFNMPLVFRSKTNNIIGLQLADLCAYPCSRHILNPKQNNTAFNIVKKHIFTASKIKRWKIFP